MAHDERVERLIPWHANGTLAEAERGELEVHLEGCPECRSLLDEATVLKELGGESAGELLDHVQAQHLERYARDPEEVPPDLAEWIRRHLDGCDACAGALGVLRQVVADPELSPPPEEPEGKAAAPRAGRLRPVRARHRPRRGFVRGVLLHPAAAALYLAALLLSVPFYLGLVRLPGTTPGVSDGGPRPALGGAVDLVVLSSPLRGEPRVPRVVVAPGQPLVPLAAELALPEDTLPQSEVAISLLRGDIPVWSTRVAAGRVAANLDASGLLTLLVPAASLVPGGYRIEVELDGRRLLDAPFEITAP